MTDSEAIEILKNNEERKTSGRYIIIKNMSIKALEKQIPKRPDIEGDGYADGHLVYDTWICPNCGKYYEIDYDNYDYCPNCGQHIDRSQLN